MTDTPKPITRPQTIADAKAKAVVEHRAAQVANAPANRVTAIKAMLDMKAAALTALTGNQARTQQLISILLGRVSRQPELLACEPVSLYLAMQQLASMGLSPLEERKHFYLLPYRNKNLGGKMEAQLRVSYIGLTHLAMRHPEVVDVFSEVVYAGEPFTFDRFSGAVKHEAPLRAAVDEKKLVAAYATVRMRDGRFITSVLSRAQVEARRAKAQGMTFWNAWPEEMWKKTALNNVLRGERVPKIDALAEALDGESSEEIKLAEFDDVTPIDDVSEIAGEPAVDYSAVPDLPEGGPTIDGLIARADELMGHASITWQECQHYAAKHNGGVIPEALADLPHGVLVRLVDWLQLAADAQKRRHEQEAGD